MKYNYALYVPSTINGEALSEKQHAEWCEKYVSIMLEKFSGLTVIKASGYWKSNSENLVVEEVCIIKASSSANSRKFIVTLAEKIKKDMKQECVSYEINGILNII